MQTCQYFTWLQYLLHHIFIFFTRRFWPHPSRDGGPSSLFLLSLFLFLVQKEVKQWHLHSCHWSSNISTGCNRENTETSTMTTASAFIYPPSYFHCLWVLLYICNWPQAAKSLDSSPVEPFAAQSQGHQPNQIPFKPGHFFRLWRSFVKKIMIVSYWLTLSLCSLLNPYCLWNFNNTNLAPINSKKQWNLRERMGSYFGG